MPQLDLFGTPSRIILDDYSGSIVYHAGALEAMEAAALFERLMREIEWRSERRMMYDREVAVPRLVASVAAPEAAAFGLEAALEIVESLARARFSSIGLNLYRDGRDSVAPHNDTLGDLEPHAPIALLSLGAARRMTIRSKGRPRRIFDLDLEPGSVLVMSYATQHHYDHGIPKTNETVGPRISAAFRARGAF